MLIEFTLEDMAVGVITRGEWFGSDGSGLYKHGGHTIDIAKKSHTQTTARVWRCCFTMFAGGPGGQGRNYSLAI